jgi:hypothetical protein
MKMVKIFSVVTSLLFLSTAGMAAADEVALQTDKANLNTKISNDQNGVDQSDNKIGEDSEAVGSGNDSIRNDKIRMNSHYANLMKDRDELKAAKAAGDAEKIKEKVSDIRRDHRAMYKDSVKLARDRAKRKNSIKNLKKDELHRDSDVSKLDSNGQDLNKTNEKIAD